MQSEKLVYEERLEHLAERVDKKIRELLSSSFEESLLSRKNKKKREGKKNELRSCLYKSGTGDEKAKKQVKEVICDILIEQENMDIDKIEEIFPFSKPKFLDEMYKFQLLLYKEEKKTAQEAFSTLVEKTGWLTLENHITKAEVESVYLSSFPEFDFLEKLEFLTQLLYSMLYGLGVVDALLEQHIDGISGGTSYGGEQEASVWVQWKGRSIYLECLNFGSKEELIRVCRRICRFEQSAQFTSEKGYLVCELAEGSRVVVTRPPFSESWSFFVRKFDTIESRTLEALIRGKNAQLPIHILEGLIVSQTTMAITGEQGSGKTTLLSALVGCISPELNLRVQEMNFELHIRRYYPNRNCITFRETETISTQEGLDLQKKTDGAVNILSEVATHEAGSYMIQMGLTASLFTLFTHHATTTENLVFALRNSLLLCGQFHREEAATQQVIEIVRFDVHLVKDRSGRRRIERITEILPSPMKDGTCQFQTIVAWNREEECYEMVGDFSEPQKKHMQQVMTKEEWIKWQEWYENEN